MGMSLEAKQSGHSRTRQALAKKDGSMSKLRFSSYDDRTNIVLKPFELSEVFAVLAKRSVQFDHYWLLTLKSALSLFVKPVGAQSTCC